MSQQHTSLLDMSLDWDGTPHTLSGRLSSRRLSRRIERFLRRHGV